MDDEGKLIPFGPQHELEKEIDGLRRYQQDLKDKFLQGKPLYKIAEEYGASRQAVSVLIRG